MLKDRNFRLLTTEFVLLLHSKLIHPSAGAEVTSCDYGLIDSAVCSTKNLNNYHPEKDLFDLAANYGYHIGKNHAFGDGNKRTAYFSIYTFLACNGVSINVAIYVLKKAYKDLERLVIGTIDQQDYAKILRSRHDNVLKRKWWQFWIPRYTEPLFTEEELDAMNNS